MNRVEARFRIVTPMFIGDAEQKATSIRPPSIKGALRFWWRAIRWPRFIVDTKGELHTALKQLHAEESRLFGAAAGKDSGGQGAFLLRVPQQPAFKPDTSWPRDGSGATTGSGYMAFGILASGSAKKGNIKPHREGIPEKLEFTLEARFRPGADPVDIEEIKEAIRAWGLLGGLGSRSRRGMGSITLLSLNNNDCLLTKVRYQEEVERILGLGASVAGLPPFTAISSQAKFALISEGADARKVHDDAGNKYRNHRGQPGKLHGHAKIGFGLPLQGVTQDDRRASPLLFHVQELAGKQYAAGCLYLPAFFHRSHAEANLKPVAAFIESARLHS